MERGGERLFDLYAGELDRRGCELDRLGLGLGTAGQEPVDLTLETRIGPFDRVLDTKLPDPLSEFRMG